MRQSIRKFDFTPLTQEKKQEIEEYAKSIKPLLSEVSTQIVLLEQKDMKPSPLKVKAPYYLVFCSRRSNGYYENAGYLAEQMALYLHKIGLGCCYSGMAKVGKQAAAELEFEPIAVIAFGEGKACIDRNVKDFKRKELSEIYSGTKYEEIIEAARLAPSAVNSQPWYFSERGNIIDVYRVKNKGIKETMIGVKARIDVGIAICHLCIAANHLGFVTTPIILGNRRMIKNKVLTATVALLKI